MKIIPYIIIFESNVNYKIPFEFCGQVINIQYWDSINSYVHSHIPDGVKYDLYEMDKFQDKFNFEGFNCCDYWLGYFYVEYPNDVA